MPNCTTPQPWRPKYRLPTLVDRLAGKASHEEYSKCSAETELTCNSGCFANSANNVTADFTVSEGKMTVTRCIAACNELGYGWAGIQARDRTSPRPVSSVIGCR